MVLLHRIALSATPEAAYAALTTSAGLAGWWTADSTAESRVGGSATFGFDRRQVVFRMRIDELVPDKKVVWSCLGEHPEWKDTHLTWTISRDGDTTTVELAHDGWASSTPYMKVCNTMWGHLMFRLKDYGEGKGSNPYWTE